MLTEVFTGWEKRTELLTEQKLKLKLKTQGKSSTSGGHFPPFERNSRKKLNLTYISLDTEKFHDVPLFMPFLLTNISKF